MRAFRWFGVPWTKHDKEEYQRGYQKLQAEFIDKGTLRSGIFEQAAARYKRLQWRQRAYFRLAALAILVAVAAAAGSVYSDNRILDAVGRSLGALIGGLALLAFVVTRTNDS
jgi:hypothetical protein